jgi:hypothetical protein
MLKFAAWSVGIVVGFFVFLMILGSFAEPAPHNFKSDLENQYRECIIAQSRGTMLGVNCQKILEASKRF